jgi:flagellar biosynthesis protein FlhB
MSGSSAGDKTEKATPKKRDEARQEGQVARSQEVNSAFAMLGSFLMLMVWGPRVWQELAREMRRVLENLHTVTLTSKTVMKMFFEVVQVMTITTGPFLLGLGLVAIIASVIQVKPAITPKAIKPKFSKMNPISGFKQKFSPSQLVELAKNLLKLVAVGAPACMVVWGRKAEVLSMGDMEPQASAAITADIIMEIGLKVGAIFLFIALLDWVWQKHRFEKQLRMSKSEIKQEARQQELAPELKAQQRRKQREMARRRMLDEVPNADVIITNPTHYSVALKYSAETGAPRVVAKGVDLLAKRIREIADEHGVTRVENVPLARELYARVEVGQHIPPDLFGVVAEILAYVYRLEKRQPKAERAAEFARRKAAASAAA